MRAAMHLAILMMTVYDYFNPKKRVTMDDYEDDEETTKNTDYLLMGKEPARKRFKSMSDADIPSESLYPFDSDDEEKDEDEQRREEGYTRMTDAIEGVNTQPEQPGIITRFWNGTT